MVKVQKTIHIDRDVAQAVRIASAYKDCSFSEMIETLAVEALDARAKKESGE